MAEEQVRLARDKAEAARGQAWLRFSMSVGESLSSMTGAITQGCRTGREDRQSLDQSGEVPGERPHRDSHRDIDNRDVDRVVGLTCEAFRASDEAFGFGERIRRAETDGAELEARAETSKTRAEQARIEREETDDALADARQCYRDLLNGQGGGES